MFTRLTAENRSVIKKGSQVLKYPVDGEPVELLPADAPQVGDLLEVVFIGIDGEDIGLAYQPLPNTDIAGMTFSGQLELNKYLSDMIAERLWWIQSK